MTQPPPPVGPDAHDPPPDAEPPASPTPPPTLRIAAAISAHASPVHAAEEVAVRCRAALAGAQPDLVLIFLTAQHADPTTARAVSTVIRRRLGPRCLLGVSGESIVGGETELEGAAGVSLWAATLPGVKVHPFKLEDVPIVRDPGPEELAAVAAAMGMTADDGLPHRATFLFADPFSVAINAVLPTLAAARPRDESGAAAPILGGMASASARPGGNVLLYKNEVLTRGAVGVSLRGNIRVDALVSQGCRPFGPTAVVTGAKNQLIKTLGGRPAMQVLHEALERLDENSRKLLHRGLFLGRVVNEYKDRFGRGDYLIRSVVGVDQDSGAIAVADLMRVGQTVRFHLRDAATADEDLALLLDAQRLYDPPAGALLFTCNARGQRLFDKPHHDATAIARAFAGRLAAEEKARAGTPLAPVGVAGKGAAAPPLPLAGFFAAGEIGPVGDGVFLHGHTACAALFREVGSEPDPAEPQ